MNSSLSLCTSLSVQAPIPSSETNRRRRLSEAEDQDDDSFEDDDIITDDQQQTSRRLDGFLNWDDDDDDFDMARNIDIGGEKSGKGVRLNNRSRGKSSKSKSEKSKRCRSRPNFNKKPSNNQPPRNNKPNNKPKPQNNSPPNSNPAPTVQKRSPFNFPDRPVDPDFGNPRPPILPDFDLPDNYCPDGCLDCSRRSPLKCPSPALKAVCDPELDAEYPKGHPRVGERIANFKDCYNLCKSSFCCIHDSRSKEVAPSCAHEYDNCPLYYPCYVVWWKLHDTAGPATYLDVEEDTMPFYKDVDLKWLALDWRKDLDFKYQLFGHHFDDDDGVFDEDGSLIDDVFQKAKNW